MGIICTICGDILYRANQEGKIYATRCGHTFHNTCIFTWIERSKTCPICRHKVAPKNLIQMFFNNVTHNTEDSLEIGEDDSNTVFEIRESKIHVLNEKIIIYKKIIRKLRSKLDTVKNKNNDFVLKEQKCRELEVENNQLRRKQAELQKRVEDLHRESDAINGRIENLVNQNNNLNGYYPNTYQEENMNYFPPMPQHPNNAFSNNPNHYVSGTFKNIPAHRLSMNSRLSTRPNRPNGYYQQHDYKLREIQRTSGSIMKRYTRSHPAQ